MNTYFIAINLFILVLVQAINERCENHKYDQCQIDNKCFWDYQISCINQQECSSLYGLQCQSNPFCSFKSKQETICSPIKYDCSQKDQDNCSKDNNCKWDLTPKCIGNPQFTMKNCYFMDEEECKNNQYHCQFQSSCEDDINFCENLSKEQCIKSDYCIFKASMSDQDSGLCKQSKQYNCEEYKIEECFKSNNCFKYSTCTPKYLPFCNQLDIKQCNDSKHCRTEQEGYCSNIDIQCPNNIDQCEKNNNCILEEKTYHSCQNKLQCTVISKDNCSINPGCILAQGKCYSKNILYENADEIISQKFHLYYSQ